MLLRELALAVKGKRQDICEAMLQELRARPDWPQGMEAPNADPDMQVATTQWPT